MINLIPPKGHKVAKREYLLRLVATLSFLFGGVLVFLTVALIPTYVLVGAQTNSVLLDIAQTNSRDDFFNKADKEIRMTQAVLSQFKTTAPTLAVSTAIDEIQKVAPSGILFKTFIADEEASGSRKILAQGVAQSREVLANLKKAIEASDMFVKAEVPIADLAKDVDLPFGITISLSEER